MRFLSGTDSDELLCFTANIERNGHYIPSDCQFESVNTHKKSKAFFTVLRNTTCNCVDYNL